MPPIPYDASVLADTEMMRTALRGIKSNPDYASRFEAAKQSRDVGAVKGLLIESLGSQLAQFERPTGMGRVFDKETEGAIADLVVTPGLSVVGGGVGGAIGRGVAGWLAPTRPLVQRMVGGLGAIAGDVGLNALNDTARGMSTQDVMTNAAVNAGLGGIGEVAGGLVRSLVDPTAGKSVASAMHRGNVVDPFVRAGTAGQTVAQIDQLSAPTLHGGKSTEDVIVNSGFLDPYTSSFNPRSLKFERGENAVRPSDLFDAKQPMVRPAADSLLRTRAEYVNSLDEAFRYSRAAPGGESLSPITLRNLFEDANIRGGSVVGGIGDQLSSYVSPELAEGQVRSLKSLVKKVAEVRGLELPEDLLDSALDKYARGKPVSSAPYTQVGLQSVPRLSSTGEPLSGLLGGGGNRLAMKPSGSGLTEADVLERVLNLDLSPSELAHTYTGLLDVNRANKSYDSQTLAKMIMGNPSAALADIREFDGTLAKKLAPVVRDKLSGLEARIRSVQQSPAFDSLPMDYLAESNATYSALSKLEDELLPTLAAGAGRTGPQYGAGLRKAAGGVTVGQQATELAGKVVAADPAQAKLNATNEAFNAAFTLADMRLNPHKYGPYATNKVVVQGLVHGAGQLAGSAIGLRIPSRMDGNLSSMESNPQKTAEAIFNVLAAKHGPDAALAMASQAQYVFSKEGAKAEKLAFAKQLATIAPETINPSPDGHTVVQGEFVFPVEQAYHMQAALDGGMPLLKQATTVGNAMFGKYSPISEPVSQQEFSTQALTLPPSQFSIENLDSAFDVTPPAKFSMPEKDPTSELRGLMGEP